MPTTIRTLFHGIAVAGLVQVLAAQAFAPTGAGWVASADHAAQSPQPTCSARTLTPEVFAPTGDVWITPPNCDDLAPSVGISDR
jgi:hypothetical protein